MFFFAEVSCDVLVGSSIISTSHSIKCQSGLLRGLAKLCVGGGSQGKSVQLRGKNNRRPENSDMPIHHLDACSRFLQEQILKFNTLPIIEFPLTIGCSITTAYLIAVGYIGDCSIRVSRPWAMFS